jgi:PEP-CTERM motif-containing protein
VVNGDTSNTNDQSPTTGFAIPGGDFQLGSNEIIFKTHSFTGGSAGDPFLAARVDITAVPEPSTWALMLLSSCGLLASRRFRSRSTR